MSLFWVNTGVWIGWIRGKRLEERCPVLAGYGTRAGVRKDPLGRMGKGSQTLLEEP